jgi:MoxR-like ATPase
MMTKDWKLFRGEAEPHDDIERLLKTPPPSWRRFGTAAAPNIKKDKEYRDILLAKAALKIRDVARGKSFRLRNPQGEVRDRQQLVVDGVNAALYLRRPLLITGTPGAGKTSLAYAVARELKLGSVLCWSVTARSNLQEGLYLYDAIARLQDANLLEINKKQGQPKNQPIIDPLDIGQYIRLGPVGTAFLPSRYPRVLLIDEVDKGDINLPNDLLNLLEEGAYSIPELKRLAKHGNPVQKVESDDDIVVEIPQGYVQCHAFPLVIMTSNGEREFPSAFYRRCLRVQMPTPEEDELVEIVKAHLGGRLTKQVSQVIKDYAERLESEEGNFATDQLLNLIYLMKQDADPEAIAQIVLQSLSEMG